MESGKGRLLHIREWCSHEGAWLNKSRRYVQKRIVGRGWDLRDTTWDNTGWAKSWLKLDGLASQRISLTAVHMYRYPDGKKDVWYPHGRAFTVTVGFAY